MRFISASYLKKENKQAADLPSNLKAFVKEGTSLTVLAQKEIDEKTLLVTFNQNIPTEDGSVQYNTWYVYKPHTTTSLNATQVAPNATGTPFKVLFTMRLGKSSTLRYGLLEVLDRSGNRLLSAKATSGATGYQTKEHFNTRARGCCPPAKGLKVATKGYYLATKGVEGLFFHVTPDPIPGYSRSEMGIHYDANVPGSAGCLVFTYKADFSRYCTLMNSVSETSLPLEITYL